LFEPAFLKLLADPSVRTVMLCGCGGGFDFVHSMALYPELNRLGKEVVIGSYSFGDPARIQGDTEIVFRDKNVIVKRVTAASVPDPSYGPEVHVCRFLDERFPKSAPHHAYAYYARHFTVPMLHRLYEQLRREHAIDAFVLVDGGSDSLMVGDEEGLGDPIEDCVSVTAVALLEGLKAKILISVGLGCDRFNHVSDAASLRAVAELTAIGGFLGGVAMEPTSVGFLFYRDCLDHIYERQAFRSIIGGAIASAAEGHFAADEVPPRLQSQLRPGELFLWPLMSVFWAFDVDKVAQRSQMSEWIRDTMSVKECYDAVFEGRGTLAGRVRDIENLPRHEEMQGPYNIWGRQED
jgi:hypothetical protein